MALIEIAGWLTLSLLMLGLWLRQAHTMRDETDFIMLAVWSFAAAVSIAPLLRGHV